jgi:hypothetical protein
MERFVRARGRALARSPRWWLGAAACWLSLAVPVAPVAAEPVPGADGWAPAAGAAGDNTYEGFIDGPSGGATIPLGASFHVTGWIVDMAADGWAGIDDVQVLNGNTVLAAHGAVGNSRPDVAAATGNPFWAASGFDAVVVPGTGLPAGPAVLTVAAHTPGKGSWSKQINVSIAGGGAVITSPASNGLVLTIIAPGPGENVVANNNGILRGVAYDTRTRAELGTGVDRVQAYLDGARGVADSQNLGTAALSGNTWSLAWEPTRYDHVRHHVLFVYAHSNVTGEERLVNLEIDIVH